MRINGVEEEGRRGGGGGGQRGKEEKREKREEGVAPRYRRFLRGRGMEVRPFIISRHAPASQQYRPLTISGSHTTPSTATLRPRSNYRENADRGPLSCFQLLPLSFADTDLSGKGTPVFLSGDLLLRNPLRSLLRFSTFPINISFTKYLCPRLGNREELLSVPRPNPVT